MAGYKYSKLGYGDAEDVEAAIALGLIDGKDMVITKDTSELIYVRDDLTVQKIRPRDLVFDTVTDANQTINANSDSYVGLTVMIKNENGKYAPWTVQKSASTERLFVEPLQVSSTQFVWQEF